MEKPKPSTAVLKHLREEAKRRVEAPLPEDEHDYTANWVYDIAIQVGIEHGFRDYQHLVTTGKKRRRTVEPKTMPYPNMKIIQAVGLVIGRFNAMHTELMQLIVNVDRLAGANEQMTLAQIRAFERKNRPPKVVRSRSGRPVDGSDDRTRRS